MICVYWTHNYYKYISTYAQLHPPPHSILRRNHKVKPHNLYKSQTIEKRFSISPHQLTYYYYRHSCIWSSNKPYKPKNLQKRRRKMVGNGGGKLTESIVQEPEQTNQSTHTYNRSNTTREKNYQWNAHHLVFQNVGRLIAWIAWIAWLLPKILFNFVVCHRGTVVIVNKELV